MADTSLASRILGLVEDDRKSVLKQTHALHDLYRDQWTVQTDAYVGSGGFLDGSYLWQYKRETSSDYLARKAQARYHNFAKTIVETYVRYVLGKPITRQTTSRELEAFWADVDGAGTDIQSLMVRWLRLALATGQHGALVDKTPDEPTGPSRADERARPMVTLYAPTAVLDWRIVGNVLVGLKLAEAAPSGDILDGATNDGTQVLIWTPEEWARFTEDGELVTTQQPEGIHSLGRIPFVMLRPEQSAVHPFLGQSLLGDANVYKALYNRCSEEDEVLRGQSFSIFVIQANSPDDVERIKQQFSGEVGVTRAVVTSGTATYETPDQAVPEAIRKNITWLVQEIFRVAHIRFKRDSLDAESGESIRLQHSELNEMLVGTAQACRQAEIALARHFFDWTTPDLATSDRAFEQADVQVGYPSEFFIGDMLQDLEELSAVIALDFGATFERAQKKRMARRYDPSMDVATLADVDAEIDAQPSKQERQQQIQQGMADSLLTNTAQRFGVATPDAEAAA